MKAKALAAYKPGGLLEDHRFELEVLPEHYVRIKVLYCGLSRSDFNMINNDWFMSEYPLVPGHEVIGVIVDKGDAVTKFHLHERVGLGWHSEYCLTCELCDSGNHHLCPQARATVVGRNGGLANYVDAHAQSVVSIPNQLSSDSCPPLLSAGAAVFYPLVEFELPPRCQAAIIGVGGLGHLALDMYLAWGMDVTVFLARTITLNI